MLPRAPSEAACHQRVRRRGATPERRDKGLVMSMYGAMHGGGTPAMNPGMKEQQRPEILLSRLRESVREDTWGEYCKHLTSFCNNQVCVRARFYSFEYRCYCTRTRVRPTLFHVLTAMERVPFGIACS